MGIELKQQAASLLLNFLLGAALGFLYDILRSPRYKAGKLTGAALDLLFCLSAGWGLFCLAMRSGSGMPGTWELFCALVGFVSYMAFLSDSIIHIQGKMAEAWAQNRERYRKLTKLAEKSLKMGFKKSRK